MHVASLELCKTLHEVTGWEDEDRSWFIANNPKKQEFVGDEQTPGLLLEYGRTAKKVCPAYSLGFLARKLRDEIKANPEYGYAERIMSADNPEDEAAEICIGLVKGGHLDSARHTKA